MQVPEQMTLGQIVEWLAHESYHGAGVTLFYTPTDRENLGWTTYQEEGLVTPGARVDFWREQLGPYMPERSKSLNLHLRRSTSGHWDPNNRRPNGMQQKRPRWIGEGDPIAPVLTPAPTGTVIPQILPPGLGPRLEGPLTPRFAPSGDMSSQLLNALFYYVDQDKQQALERERIAQEEQRMLLFSLIQIASGDGQGIDIQNLLVLARDRSGPLLNALEALQSDPETSPEIRGKLGALVPWLKAGVKTLNGKVTNGAAIV